MHCFNLLFPLYRKTAAQNRKILCNFIQKLFMEELFLTGERDFVRLTP